MILQLGVVAVLAATCGCSRDKAVARVGEHELTEAELHVRAENIVLLRQHKLGSKANTNALEKLRKTFERGYVKLWAEDMVLADYAKREGLVISNELIAAYQSRAYRNFKAKGDKSFADLMKIRGLDSHLFQDQVRAEALRPVVRRHLIELYPTNFPASYADDVRAAILRQNVRMAATNVLQYAKATNVWEKLKAGADFAKTAKENTEIEDEAEEGGDWLVVDAKFLSDEPELLKHLQAMKPGEFTPPLAADNGIMIARLDRHEEEGGYAVSRIYFRLAEIFEPAPPEQILAAAYKDYEDRLFRTKLDELVRAAHIVIYSDNRTEKRK